MGRRARKGAAFELLVLATNKLSVVRRNTRKSPFDRGPVTGTRRPLSSNFVCTRNGEEGIQVEDRVVVEEKEEEEEEGRSEFDRGQTRAYEWKST